MSFSSKSLIVLLILSVVGSVFLFQQQCLTQANQRLEQAQSHIEILQSKVDQAQHAVQTVTKYIDRVRVVRERASALIQKVPTYVSEKDNIACTLPVGVIRLHNLAASQMPVTDTEPVNEAASGIALTTFASAIANNYSRCHENAEQLVALQKLVAPLRESIDEERIP